MSGRNALTSLWGRGGPDMGMEDTKLLNGSRQGEREQRVLTPPNVLAAVRRVWTRGIVLDPCGAPGNPTEALRYACPDDDGAHYRDGLAMDWPPFTYANPPYDKLSDWITHAARFDEVMLLGPVRPHRTWWREAVFGRAAAVCWLDPIAFVGHDQVFPAPLCVTYWGSFGARFRVAFALLGTTTLLSSDAERLEQITLTWESR